MQFPILTKADLSATAFEFTLDISKGYPPCHPGQFVRIDVNDHLPRPISIARRTEFRLTFVVETRGPGTSYLYNLPLKSLVDISAPLGKGFQVTDDKPYLLVGGGVGAAPIYSLASDQNANRANFTALLCFQTQSRAIMIDHFHNCLNQVLVTTDDGSLGQKGRADEVLEKHLMSSGHPPYAGIIACGPELMLESIARIAAHYEYPCQVSLEEYMGCGNGACKGCARELADDTIAHICVCGPVFDAKEVKWHA